MDMNETTGGQAFPIPAFSEPRMTLFDYYVGQALANPGLARGRGWNERTVVSDARAIAREAIRRQQEDPV